jgi:4-hydroxy-3-methylbut-2-en-1-yl diphosphate reductase
MQAGQSTQSPKSPRKINLRTPDVMEAVQAHRSELVDHIRANGNQVTVDGLTIRLAKEFGFCYGVERAIDLAYAARKVFKEKPLYLIGEIIHNPEVNHQIKAMGIQVICGKESDVDADIERLQAGDIVIIPAFGAEVSVMDRIRAKGCEFVDTSSAVCSRSLHQHHPRQSLARRNKSHQQQSDVTRQWSLFSGF